MASRDKDRRVNSSKRRNGNTAEGVKKPRKSASAPEEKNVIKKRKRVVGSGYVIFLSLICAATFALCVFYLQQKAAVTRKYDNMATLQARYNTLKNDNDARYNQVLSSVTLDEVKNAAINRLGMHYPDSEHIRYYTLTDDSYVRQYTEVSEE